MRGGGFTRLFGDTPDTQLGLGFGRSPTPPLPPLGAWDGPQNHEVVLPDGRVSGRPNDGVDDTPSIHAAIDSGAEVVYLPNGEWTVDGTISLRGNVARFLGAEASMSSSLEGAEPRVVIGTDGPATVTIERFANYGFGVARPLFEHASSRTVVFNDITGLDYEATAARPGRVYINDCVGRSITFRGGQRVYATQLNIEEDNTLPGASQRAKVVNDGAVVAILGFKTEMDGVHVETINGGRTEVMGQLHLNDFGTELPQYVTRDAGLSVVTNIKPYAEAGTTYGLVEETRNGVTRRGRITGTGYVGYSNAQLWRWRREVIVDDDAFVRGVSYEGDWTESDAFPRGHIGDGFTFAQPGPNTATYARRLGRAGTYEVAARWVGDWGGQAHSGHARAATYLVRHAEGETAVTVDQDLGSDGWHTLGAFPFTTEEDAVVVLSADGADGVVNTDGVRFRYRR